MPSFNKPSEHESAILKPVLNKPVASMDKIKTGSIQRRWSLAKAGLMAGARHVGRSAGGWLLPAEQRKVYTQQSLTREAFYFVSELGKLKGGVVKAGQILASWGDAFFPPAVSQALHVLESQTIPLDWLTIQQQLLAELGSVRLQQFTLDPIPIGCASLAQVHRAHRIADGAQLCFKIQYPGVAESIDSDMAMLTQLLYVTNLLPRTRDFDHWLSAVKMLLKQELDYQSELLTTQRFKEYLITQPDYCVPSVYPEYSTTRVLACSFEQGVKLNSHEVLSLSSARRNRIAELCLDLFWQEIWVWGEMQTDPNFGNYLLRMDNVTAKDTLILLDFGAVYRFDERILHIGRQLIICLCQQNRQGVKQALLDLDFLQTDFPNAIFEDLYALLELALEPFKQDSLYTWSSAHLTQRLMAQASKTAFSQYFKVPPKDLLFVGRKIMGAFSLMHTLGANINGYRLLNKYLS